MFPVKTPVPEDGDQAGITTRYHYFHPAKFAFLSSCWYDKRLPAASLPAPRRPAMPVRARRLLCILILLVACSRNSHVASAAVPEGYESIAKPFIAQHCLGCHGEQKAKAGYRVDLIGTDFTAPTVAEHWKELLDRINVGEMPPEGSPGPMRKSSRLSPVG